MNGKKNSRAFTLVEIVVVIAVIGILAAVLIPSFVSILSESRRNDHYERVTSVRDEYFFDNDDFSSLSDMRGHLFIIDDEVYEVSITGEINKSDFDLSEIDLENDYIPVEDYSGSDSSVTIYAQTAISTFDRAIKARNHYHAKNGFIEIETAQGKKPLFYEMNHYIITVWDNDSEQDVNFEVTYAQNPDGSVDFERNGTLVLTDKTIESLEAAGLYYTTTSSDLDTWAGVVYAPTEETKLYNRILELEEHLADDIVWDDIILGFDGGNVKQSNYVYCVESESGISLTSSASVTKGRLYTVDPQGKVYSLGDTMISGIQRQGYRFLTTNEVSEDDLLTKVKIANQGELVYSKIDCYAIFYGYYNDDTSYATDGYHLWTDFLLKYNGGTSTSSINYNASMSEYSIKRLVVSDEITAIGDSAFTNYNDLTEVILPESLETINVTTKNPFANGKINYILVNDRNTAYTSYNNSGIIEIEDSKIIYGTNGILDNVIYVPEGVEMIGKYAFEKSNLAQISIVGLEVEIGAFKDCTSLVNVSHDLTEIPDELFSGCTSLRLISDITNVTSIGSEAFKGCTSVNDEDDSEPSLSLTTELVNIGTNAFYNNNIKLYYSSSRRTFRTSVTGYENTNHLTIEYALKDVTYDLQGGTVTGVNPDMYDPTSNEELNLISPEKEGYIFRSWGVRATDNESEVFDDIEAGESLVHPYKLQQGEAYNNKDITLTAQYERVVFDIIYMVNGEDITSTLESDYPKTFNKLSTDEMYIFDQSRDYYDFNGWYDGETFIDNWFNPYGRTENAILNATFVAHEYSITYYYYGGVAENPETYTVETETFTLEHPVKADYTFDNWLNETDGVRATDIVITRGASPKNLTIHAEYHATEYYFTYDFRWGTVPLVGIEEGTGSPVLFTVVSGIINIPDPKPTDGYDFIDWYVGSEKLVGGQFVCANYHGNTTLTAQFEPWTYTVTYGNADINPPNNGKDGVILNYNNATVYHYGQDMTLNTPAMKNGYRFVSWTGVGVASSWIVSDGRGGYYIHNATSNMTIKANWELVEYDINYVHPEGTTEGATPNPISYNVEDDAITLSAVNRTGYIFSGWTGSNGEVVQMSVTINCPETFGAKTYYSHWTEQEYTITYNNLLNSTPTNGGNPDVYTIETDTFTLNNPTRVGYTFDGWSGTNISGKEVIVTITKGTIGNKIYTANWTPIVYTITYTLNDGDDVPENKTEYTIEYETFEIIESTRTGYEFIGWTGTDLDEPTTSFEIEQGTIGNKEYEAQWEIVVYDITYILKFGAEYPSNPTVTPANPDTYTVEDDEFTLTNPIGIGYTFRGWSGTDLGDDDSRSFEVTLSAGRVGDRVYTAHWTMDTYTIHYDYDDGELGEGEENPANYTVEDDSFTLYNPTKVGYTFKGWTGTGLATPQTTVTITKGVTVGNKEYIANYDPIVYNLTVNLFDGTVAPLPPETYTIESDPITINPATKVGYRFLGWTGTGYLEAQNSIIINTGSMGDKTYNANWEIIPYNITYNLGGGTVTGTNPTTYYVTSPDINLINPSKFGYTFDGWSGPDVTDAYAVTIESGSIGNRTYTAHWTINTYYVSYEYNNGVIAGGNNAGPTSFTVVTAPFTLTNPTRRGYTFAGWTDGLYSGYETDGYVTKMGSPVTSVTVTPSTEIGSRTYTANWDIILYSINYSLEYGTFETEPISNYTVETANFTLPVPTRTYYRFDGWTGSNGEEEQTSVVIAQGTIGNLSYIAHWTLMRFDILYHNYTDEELATNRYGMVGITEAIEIFPTEYYSDNDSFVLENPTKVGYNFAGWQQYTPRTDNKIGDPKLTVTINKGDTGDKEFGATWSIVTYTILYNLNNGSLGGETNPTTYNIETPTFELNNPSRVGYIFDGWTGTNIDDPITAVSIGLGSTGNRSYLANYTAKTYNVNLDANGGSGGNTSVIATYDSPMPAITVATRTGYTLNGYFYFGSVKYYNADGSSARTWDMDVESGADDVTLYAGWTPNKYTVTLNQQSGSGGTASVTATFDADMPSAVAPSRTGYTFGGYYDVAGGSGNQYYTASMTSARTWDKPNAATLYAKWTVIDYTISYNLNGGSASNPTSYNIETATFTLSNPSKSGYNFDGWSGTGISGTSKSVSISKGSTGNRSYTANWSYAVGDGGDGAEHEFMCSGSVNDNTYPHQFRVVWRRSGGNWRTLTISCIIYNPSYTTGYNYIKQRHIAINGSDIYYADSVIDSSANGGKGPCHGYTFMSKTYTFDWGNGQHTVNISAGGAFYYYGSYNVTGSSGNMTFGLF